MFLDTYYINSAKSINLSKNSRKNCAIKINFLLFATISLKKLISSKIQLTLFEAYAIFDVNRLMF